MPGKFNKTLYGKFGDLVNGWSNLAIFVNKCDPAMQTCHNETYTDSVLSDGILRVIYLSYDIDHYNSTSPNNYKVESTLFPVSSSLIKSYYYSFAQTVYTTDYGLIFQDNKENNFFVYDYQSININLVGVSNSVAASNNIGYVLFINADAVSYYYRKYVKGQEVITNIGGIVQAIMVIANIISSLITRKMRNIELSKYIFQFEEGTLDQKIRIHLTHIGTIMY